MKFKKIITYTINQKCNQLSRKFRNDYLSLITNVVTTLLSIQVMRDVCNQIQAQLNKEKFK